MKLPSFTLLASAVFLSSLGAILLGDGDLRIALVPLVLVGLVLALGWLPLRIPLLVTTFLALTLESPSDVPAAGLWQSPLYPLGTVLLAHMNLTFPTQGWMIFSGLDLVLVSLLGVAFVRWARRPRAERVAGEASPMRFFAGLSLAAIAFIWLWGFLQGGADVPSSLWQIQRVVYLPLFYFLFQSVLRGPRDRASLATVLVVAACIKAMVAIYVRATVPPRPPAVVLDYATTHADSMLFAAAFCVVVTLLVEKASRRTLLLAGFVLPLLLAGMIANHRRVVWVELGAGLLVVYGLSAAGAIRRTITRAAVLLSPLVLLYALVGWGSSSPIFGPVAVVRSIVDSKADPSTEWRDWENYNLFFTIKQSPFLGTGYGHGYIETVKLPDISQAYGLYRFIPHNSILGLWAYGGLFGFGALWAMMFVGVYLAVRAAKHARTPGPRAAAIASTAAIVVYLVHCYGDMGLGTWTSIFLVAPAFAVGSELAVLTGAWPSRAPRGEPGLVAVRGAPMVAASPSLGGPS